MGRTKIDLHLPPGHTVRLGLGGETSLWNSLLVNWVSWIQAELVDVAVDSQVDAPKQLITALERGLLDATIVHRLNYYSDFLVEPLLKEKLIHVQKVGDYEPNRFINGGVELCRNNECHGFSPKGRILPNQS